MFVSVEFLFATDSDCMPINSYFCTHIHIINN